MLFTAAGTVLLMAPSVYHRLRWNQGGKSDVVRVAHLFLLGGTAFIAVGIVAAVALVADVLFGSAAAIVSACGIGAAVAIAWYLVPAVRGRSDHVRAQE